MFENISLVAKGKVLPNKTISWNLINISVHCNALDPCFHLGRSGDKNNIWINKKDGCPVCYLCFPFHKSSKGQSCPTICLFEWKRSAWIQFHLTEQEKDWSWRTWRTSWNAFVAPFSAFSPYAESPDMTVQIWKRIQMATHYTHLWLCASCTIKLVWFDEKPETTKI